MHSVSLVPDNLFGFNISFVFVCQLLSFALSYWNRCNNSSSRSSIEVSRIPLAFSTGLQCEFDRLYTAKHFHGINYLRRVTVGEGKHATENNVKIYAKCFARTRTRAHILHMHSTMHSQTVVCALREITNECDSIDLCTILHLLIHSFGVFARSVYIWIDCTQYQSSWYWKRNSRSTYKCNDIRHRSSMTMKSTHI